MAAEANVWWNIIYEWRGIDPLGSEVGTNSIYFDCYNEQILKSTLEQLISLSRGFRVHLSKTMLGGSQQE